MQVVVPQPVQAVAAFLGRPDQPGFLRLVFGNKKDRARAGFGPRLARDLGQNMLLRFIENALGGIEPEAVEMEFLDPVARVADEKLAHWPGVWAVEI